MIYSTAVEQQLACWKVTCQVGRPRISSSKTPLLRRNISQAAVKGFGAAAPSGLAGELTINSGGLDMHGAECV